MVKKNSFPKNNKGFGIIGAIVGITIASLLLIAFTTLISQTIKINHANIVNLKATMYLQELIEIAKDLEQSNSGWQVLTNASCIVSSPCYFAASGSDWTLVQDPTGVGETLENGDYIRWLIIEKACRDSNDQIVDCTIGTESTSTKKVIAKITWYDGFKNTSSMLETYLYEY